MTDAQLLVNGLISAPSLPDALRTLRDPDHWLNAYPHGSGLPHGKIRPFRKQYAPVILRELNILGAIPYVSVNNEEVNSGTIAHFAFAALITLSSSEAIAIQYALHNGTWFEPRVRQVFDGIVWSAADTPGNFAHLCEGI